MPLLSESPARESERTTVTTPILRDYTTYTTTSERLGFTELLDFEPHSPMPGQSTNPYEGSFSSLKLSNTEEIEPSVSSVFLSSIDEQTSRLLRKIAKEHFEIEPELSLIAVYSKKPAYDFLLIEVNEEAIPTGSIEPFYFAPTEDFPWPIHVADITRNEWTKLESNNIKMPPDWPNEPSLIFHRDEVMKL